MTKKSFLFLGLIILSGFIISNVSAANVGISPARVEFKDVLRGGYAERFITVTIDSDSPIGISIEPLGNIAQWFNFSSLELNVSKSRPGRIRLSTTPPKDTPNGKYDGFVRVKTSGLGNSGEGQITGIVRAAVDLSVNVEIVDNEYKSCGASDFSISSVEKGENLNFIVNIENRGNIFFSPEVRVDIWNQEQTQVVKSVSYSEKIIKPTTIETINVVESSSDLELGQYWAEISAVDCFSKQTLTFDVLEPGALRSEGIFKGIVVKPWSQVGETIPLSADFINVGEKIVSAQFKGRITFGNDIIQLVESDPQIVNPKETLNYSFYFTPNNAGKYIISGRYFYSGKRTFELSSVMNVVAVKSFFKSYGKYVIYAIVLLIIAFLISRIRKEKENYFDSIKRIRSNHV